jgi:DNA-binding transcriptional regulator YhcF (GntR family)
VTQPKSPTPHGKVVAMVQEMNRFSSIDKNARRTYRANLKALLQDAKTLGVSNDELVQSVQAAFTLLETKSVGS